jgi:hypothetical protein
VWHYPNPKIVYVIIFLNDFVFFKVAEKRCSRPAKSKKGILNKNKKVFNILKSNWISR